MPMRCHYCLMKLSKLILNVFLTCSLAGVSSAQTKVVVVPLGNDSGPRVNNVVNVALSGGDFRRVEDAVASITDASANNPYLVYVAPGDYRLRRTLQMKPFVDVVGSGVGITRLVGTLITVGNSEGCFSSSIVAVLGGGGSKLANVSIIHGGAAGEARIGVCTENPDNGDTSISLDNVSILVQSATTNFGVIVENSVRIDESTINASVGVRATFDGVALITNSSIKASTGLSANSFITIGGGRIDIRGSQVIADEAVSINGSGARVAIRNSVINGRVEVGEFTRLRAYGSQFNTIFVNNGSASDVVCLHSSLDDQVLNANCLLD